MRQNQLIASWLGERGGAGGISFGRVGASCRKPPPRTHTPLLSGLICGWTGQLWVGRTLARAYECDVSVRGWVGAPPPSPIPPAWLGRQGTPRDRGRHSGNPNLALECDSQHSPEPKKIRTERNLRSACAGDDIFSSFMPIICDDYVFDS